MSSIDILNLSIVKNKIVLSLALFLLLGCSSQSDQTDQSDDGLLKADQKNLLESLDSYKVTLYRFAKIGLRSSVVEDEHTAEFAAFKTRLDQVTNQLTPANGTESKSLSVMDYISIYREYQAMKKFVKATDEDIFPTLSQVIEYKNETGPNTLAKKCLYMNVRKPIPNIFQMVRSRP